MKYTTIVRRNTIFVSCRFAKCHFAVCQSNFVECQIAECQFAECCYFPIALGYSAYECWWLIIWRGWTIALHAMDHRILYSCYHIHYTRSSVKSEQLNQLKQTAKPEVIITKIFRLNSLMWRCWLGLFVRFFKLERVLAYVVIAWHSECECESDGRFADVSDHGCRTHH